MAWRPLWWVGRAEPFSRDQTARMSEHMIKCICPYVCIRPCVWQGIYLCVCVRVCVCVCVCVCVWPSITLEITASSQCSEHPLPSSGATWILTVRWPALHCNPSPQSASVVHKGTASWWVVQVYQFVHYTLLGTSSSVCNLFFVVVDMIKYYIMHGHINNKMTHTGECAHMDTYHYMDMC